MKQLNKLSKNRLNTVESYAACMCAAVMCSCSCSCSCGTCNGVSAEYVSDRNAISGGNSVPPSNVPSGSMSYQRQHS